MYIFKLNNEDFVINVDIKYNVNYEFAKIVDGILTIPIGYAWNGCSPKISILDWFILGTPDGVVDYRTGKPKGYYASLVHDTLYQYTIGDRKHADKLFLKLLKEADFKMAYPYYYAVRWLGWTVWSIRKYKNKKGL